MSRVEFDTYVEIPISVVARLVPASGDGRNEPHVPEHVEIELVRIDDKFVREYINKAHTESLIEEAWDIIHD